MCKNARGQILKASRDLPHVYITELQQFLLCKYFNKTFFVLLMFKMTIERYALLKNHFVIDSFRLYIQTIL